MYCGKCRAENLSGAVFCGTCGAPLAEEAPTGSAAGQAALSQKPGAARNPARDRKLGIAAAAVVAAAVALGAVFLSGGRGPEATAERFFDVVLGGQAEKIIDLVPRGMVEMVMEESGCSRAKTAEEFSQAAYPLNAAMDALGGSVDLTCHAVGSENVSPDQLDYIQEQYEQMNVDVTAAKTVEMEFRIRMAGMGVDETGTYNIPVIKTGSGWYIDITGLNF